MIIGLIQEIQEWRISGRIQDTQEGGNPAGYRTFKNGGYPARYRTFKKADIQTIPRFLLKKIKICEHPARVIDA